ncbi:hypothetical protein G6F22_016514 [Rhizopus arrhizus]|nr:hypothetical protein G6F22_016514 [Rhizopus arrhizus]
MVPVNSLLFADDVAVIGSAKSVKEMLKLCEQHSLSLGYRWNPTKCAVLNHPLSSSSSSSLPYSSDRLQLYGTPLPLVDEFVYLGVPFVKSGLSAPSLVSLRSPGVIKVMAILNKIGVNRQGFSLLLCSRIYATFKICKIAVSVSWLVVILPRPLPLSSTLPRCHLCAIV